MPAEQIWTVYSAGPGHWATASPKWNSIYKLRVRAYSRKQALTLGGRGTRAWTSGTGVVLVDWAAPLHCMDRDEAMESFFGPDWNNPPPGKHKWFEMYRNGVFDSGALSPTTSQGGIQMSQHTAPVADFMSEEQKSALTAVEELEAKVAPKLSTSLDSGSLNVSARIVNLIKDAGYKTLEAAREAGEDLLNINGVGPKTLEKIQGVEAELPEVEEPIEVVEHEPQKADEAPKGDPIGLPEVSKEAAKALRKLNVHFKKTPEGRVRTTAGFFVLAPPEHLAQKGVGKNFVRSYNPNGWHGWAVSGWSPKRK